jgi:hypothetical protein
MSDTTKFIETYFRGCKPANFVFLFLMIIFSLSVLLYFIQEGVSRIFLIYLITNLITILLYSFMVTTFCRAWGEEAGWLYVLVPLVIGLLMSLFGVTMDSKSR